MQQPKQQLSGGWQRAAAGLLGGVPSQPQALCRQVAPQQQPTTRQLTFGDLWPSASTFQCPIMRSAQAAYSRITWKEGGHTGATHISAYATLMRLRAAAVTHNRRMDTQVISATPLHAPDAGWWLHWWARQRRRGRHRLQLAG